MSICCRAISLALLILVNCFVSGIKGDDGRIFDCALVECGDPSYIRINQDRSIEGKEVYVEIANFCPVPIIDLRVDCGSFIKSRVPLVPPNILKPVGGNQCVINNGNPIVNKNTTLDQDTFPFVYSSKKFLPLIVTSFKCFRPST
ncbi:hypothetical protein PIB30_086667 [Stylosanthes scabra]|uniref:Uncharacterized protein n=1 Tax=Stylosanthes scabra TaxID=79078 RepID=A0ABU6TSQ8_9FABA|nr:hypothetical protein [Stylosanthes scabra]